MKARHAHSLQQSAPPEPLTPSEEDVATVDEREDVPTIFDGAVFQDDDDRLLWRLVWGIVWCASVLLVACFAAFPIALIIRGSPEPAMQASRPEEATAQLSAAAAAPEPPGLGGQEGAFDELFGDLENEAGPGAVAFGDFPSGEIAPASEALRPQKSEFTPSAFAAFEAAAVPLETAAKLASEQGKVLASPASNPSDADAREADVLPTATIASRADPGAAADLDSAAAQPSRSAIPAFAGVSADARLAAATLARPPEVQSMEVQPALSGIRQAVAAPAGGDLEHGADRPMASAMAGQTAGVGLEAKEAAALPATVFASFGESIEITADIGSAAAQPSDRALIRAAVAPPESAATEPVPNLVAAPHFVASIANAVDRPPAAVRAVREVGVASVATPDAEPATDLDTARTAAEPSSVVTGGVSEARVADVTMPDAGRPTVETAKIAAEPSAAAAGAMLEARAAEVATAEAEPATALGTAASAVEPSAVAVRGVSEVRAAEVGIPDAERTIALETAGTAESSVAAAGATPEVRAVAAAISGAESTTALQTAGTAAESSAAGVRGMSEVPVAAVAPLDARPVTDLEAAGRVAEPSGALVAEPAELSPGTDRAYSALTPDVAGAEPDSPALDSRETSTVPAEAALPAPRLPRPRPADAVIVFAPPNLPDPVERRPEPEIPRREPAAAAQDRPNTQVSSPVRAPPELESGALALPPALLPIRPPRSGTSLGSAPN